MPKLFVTNKVEINHTGAWIVYHINKKANWGLCFRIWLFRLNCVWELVNENSWFKKPQVRLGESLSKLTNIFLLSLLLQTNLYKSNSSRINCKIICHAVVKLSWPIRNYENGYCSVSCSIALAKTRRQCILHWLGCHFGTNIYQLYKISFMSSALVFSDLLNTGALHNETLRIRFRATDSCLDHNMLVASFS